MRIADVGSGYEIGFYALLTVYLIGMAGLATRGMVSANTKGCSLGCTLRSSTRV